MCHGQGVMRWQQPSRGPDGQFLLREMEHPCVNGCGDRWKHPAGEASVVIDCPSGLPAEQEGLPSTRQKGLVDEANGIGAEFITNFVRSQGFRWGQPPE